MLTRQTISRNLPCLVRGLSTSVVLHRGVSALTTEAKKLVETQKGKPNTEDKSTLPPTRTSRGATFKRARDKPTTPTEVYIPLSAMPQLPEYLVPKPEPRPTTIDLQIPQHFIKKPPPPVTEPTPESREAIDKISDALKRYNDDMAMRKMAEAIAVFIDSDFTTSSRLEVHPIKRTASGMIPMNRALDNIEDDYLRECLGDTNTFARPPYQQNDPLGFAKWEKEFVAEREKQLLKKEENDKEYQMFVSDYCRSGNFVTSRGGRTKVNRKLLKKFKQLKKDGKLPDEDDDKDDFFKPTW
ncbi:hypothetical protein Cantr_02272 [Candida viswanathii]|uniref:Uncharacterized protein n=1 Tax=Candida viswanathii TaxID=5486 RepID=A0A367YMN4_9ASCO|nr:hypothetical protein Cantr_02272 [Candida viswanathii]